MGTIIRKYDDIAVIGRFKLDPTAAVNVSERESTKMDLLNDK